MPPPNLIVFVSGKEASSADSLGGSWDDPESRRHPQGRPSPAFRWPESLLTCLTLTLLTWSPLSYWILRCLFLFYFLPPVLRTNSLHSAPSCELTQNMIRELTNCVVICPLSQDVAIIRASAEIRSCTGGKLDGWMNEELHNDDLHFVVHVHRKGFVYENESPSLFEVFDAMSILVAIVSWVGRGE